MFICLLTVRLTNVRTDRHYFSNLWQLNNYTFSSPALLTNPAYGIVRFCRYVAKFWTDFGLYSNKIKAKTAVSTPRIGAIEFKIDRKWQETTIFVYSYIRYLFSYKNAIIHCSFVPFFFFTTTSYTTSKYLYILTDYRYAYAIFILAGMKKKKLVWFSDNDVNNYVITHLHTASTTSLYVTIFFKIELKKKKIKIRPLILHPRWDFGSDTFFW